MKRLIALLTLLCLVLCACGNQNDSSDTTVQTTTEETTVETTVETTTEETKPIIRYRNPLNGQPLEEPYTATPVAVVINNLKAALPQHGVSEADIFYEIETEGGITRCLAIFSDIEKVGSIGPIRSARSFFNSVAVSYGAPIVHCGGSVRGRNAGYGDGSDKIDGWEHIDQTYNGKYFFRDEDRYYYKGYNWEHTLFAKGAELAKAVADKGYNHINEGGTDFGLQFEDLVVLGGETANKVTISFRGDKTSTMTYDAATGLYDMDQYGSDYIDANNGSSMTFKNVMVLYADQWFRHDGEYSRSYYDINNNSGDGYLAIDGQIVPIKWSREGLRTSFSYTLADGTPITLAPGRTYIAIAGDDSTPVAYE